MTKEKAIEIMKGYGYALVSEAGNDSWLGFAKDMNGIWMSAKVLLVQDSVTLTGGVLKMMCELSCKKFDIHSTRFADFENVLYLYAKLCGQIDILVDSEGIIQKAFNEAAVAIKPTEIVEEVAPTKNNLEDRKAKFKSEVIAIGKKKNYPAKMCQKFFNYWSETNDNGKKMRWEIAKQKSGVFNTAGRMVTWYGKDNEGNFKDRDEKKAEKQNIALRKSPTTINKNELF